MDRPQPDGVRRPEPPLDEERRFAQFLVRESRIPLEIATSALEEVRERRARGEAIRLEQVLARGVGGPLDPARLGELRDKFERPGAGPAAAELPGPLAVLARDYEIGEPIGSGGFAVVHRAFRRKDGVPVAIKALRERDRNDPERLRGIVREALALRRLFHRGVVRILDAGMVAGTAFVVLEHVEGENLRSHLDRARPGLRERLEIFRRVLDAVAYCHRNGILHRDLSPENIRIAPDGEPKVLDFGLARILDPELGLTSTDGSAGTPTYMSPEQIEGVREGIDHRTDVYSLGVLLYETLAGRPPFAERHPSALYRRILQESPESPSAHAPGTPAALDAACLKALQRRPRDRFQSVAEFAAALDDAIARMERR
ncbi:MAG: serine/threonine protein kinase [Planctomycetes bacterium]|nr:serine/threonine protein kinase [Planctomycetota bacterium]